MPNRLRDPENATPEPTSRTGGNGRALGTLVLLAVSLFVNLAPSAFAAAKLTLQDTSALDVDLLSPALQAFTPALSAR